MRCPSRRDGSRGDWGIFPSTSRFVYTQTLLAAHNENVLMETAASRVQTLREKSNASVSDCLLGSIMKCLKFFPIIFLIQMGVIVYIANIGQFV